MPLGVVGTPIAITMINRLEIIWRQDVIRDLNPAPLFDMTRYVFEYESPKAFRSELDRFLAGSEEAGP